MADLFNDPDDYSSEEGVEAPPRPLGAKILGNAVKIVFWTLIILMNALLLWRLFSSGNPSELKAVTPNPELKAAYSAYLADKEAVQPGRDVLFAAHQQENSRTNITDEDADTETGFPGNYGYFALTDQVLFPTAGQAQVIFRYNLSTLDHLAEDYSLSERPDPDGDWYDVTLRVETNDGKTLRISPSAVTSAKKNRYCFRRISFEGIPDLSGVTSVYFDVYYTGDVNYFERPYGKLCIYSSAYDLDEYRLSSRDRKALQ